MTRHYVLVLLSLALTGVALAFCWAWHLQPVAGDLTRIGGWPERNFGWNARQEAAALIPTRHPVVGNSPDVVIVGDSFSLPGVWQDLASRDASFSFVTYDIEHFCLARYLASPQYRAAAPRLLIVQTVERFYLRRFGPAASCPAHAEQPVAPDPGRWAANYALQRSTSAFAVKPGFTLEALKALWRERATTGTVISGDTLNVALSSTRAFTNRRADRILLYRGDLLKQRWAASDVEASVARVRELQQRVEADGRTRFLFLFVPDKSTAYADLLADPSIVIDWRIGERLAAAGVTAPRLDRGLRSAIAAGERDVYLPNDTHLSVAGFRRLAQQVRSHLMAANLVSPAPAVAQQGGPRPRQHDPVLWTRDL